MGVCSFGGKEKEEEEKLPTSNRQCEKVNFSAKM